MPHGHDAGSGGAGLLGGLLEGFGAGSNFRTQRDDRRRQTEEAERRRAEEERARALREFTARQEHGIEFVEPGELRNPEAVGGVRERVEFLRRGVGERLMEAGGAVPLGGFRPSPLAMGQDAPENVLTATPDVGAGFRPQEALEFDQGGFRKTGPSAAERRQAEAERLRQQVGRQLAGILGVPEEEGQALHATGLGDDAFRARNRPAPTIQVAGRSFPDTPEGQQAALEWRRQSGEAGRAPGRAGSGSRSAPQSPEEAESSLYQEATRMLQRGVSPQDVANWAARDDQPYKRQLGARRIEVINRAHADLQEKGGDNDRRTAIIRTIGKQPVNELEEDIVDALAEGETAESILTGLQQAGQPPEVVRAARQFIGAASTRFR